MDSQSDRIEQALKAECAVRICIHHWNRVRQRIPAQHVIAGEGMCDPCFRGTSFVENKHKQSRGRRFNDEQVAEIRLKLSEGKSGFRLAEEYGVAERTISLIRNRRGAYR